MPVKFEIVNSLSDKDWRSFVDRHPCGNIFHTPEMFQVYSRVKGYHPRIEAVITDDECILALLLPVEITLLNGILHHLTTRSIVYGSLLCAPGKEGKYALAALLFDHSQKMNRQVLFTELRNLSDLSDYQPVLQQSGYAYEEHLNYLIDIACSPDQILQNIGARTRKHIRKCLRRGKVTSERITDRRQIQDWYTLVERTYKAARVPLAPLALFENAFDILDPKGMVQFWQAKIGTTIVAVSAELLYKDVIYGWYGGVDRQYAAELPGEMLMWHILTWGAQNGYKTYDFGGAGKPGEEYGVRDFKAKFGGRLVCFGRNTAVHSPGLLRWSELGYRLYRKVLAVL